MTMYLDPERWRNADGGFGPIVGSPSEPEATAMVALAFDDTPARGWLADAQQADGSIGMQVGSVIRDVTALGALALSAGSARELALDHLESVAGLNGSDPTVATAGWPWTDGSHGWTEPTAWGLMALRLRRGAEGRLADARAFFEERECVGGGWNYGSPETLGVPIGPYVQTTALALLALADDEPMLSDRGLRVLEATWRSESAGLLTLATAICALRRGTSRDVEPAEEVLAAYTSDGEPDAVTAAWLAFARGAPGPWETA
jgi:hypothetical protein